MPFWKRATESFPFVISYPAGKPMVLPGDPNRVDAQPNRIRCTRFTWYSWIPLSLFYQFHRVANLYFLFISVLVCFDFSTKEPITKWAPFAVVLSFTAFKDLYLDILAWKEEKLANFAQVTVYREGAFQEVDCQTIGLGELVLVRENDEVPADLLFIAGATPSAFISTMNLDGETDLKIRLPPALPEFKSRDPRGICQEFLDFQPFLSLEPWTADIYTLNGRLLVLETDLNFSGDSSLLRGTTLRNTEWALGVALYVGHRTKVLLNRSTTRFKVSNMQTMMNHCILVVLFFLIITCMYLAIMSNSLPREYSLMPYSEDQGLLVAFFAYVVTLYHLVPISLYVAYETLKLLLARTINKASVFNVDGTQAVNCRQADLVDELGQVSQIFMDKTGTLTKNVMDLRGIVLTSGSRATRYAVSELPILLDEASANSEVTWFLRVMCLCNSVQPLENLQYSGSSSDEVALVKGAASAGLILVSRRHLRGAEAFLEEINLRKGNSRDSYQILATFAFTSYRMRMSVIARSKKSGKIWCLTKGADNRMQSLLNKGYSSEFKASLKETSLKGLRVMVLARREIAPEEWELLAPRLSDPHQREQLAEEVECRLDLMGCTYVEDELQTNVPKSLSLLREAGLKLWILTGDKMETAISIGRSSGFAQPDAEVLRIQASNVPDLLQTQPDVSKALLVAVDGDAMSIILDNPAYRVSFYKLCHEVQGVICCRLSPSQKKEVIVLANEFDPTSMKLGIGDGGNDVPMLQYSHIGVGIRGFEGNQAVQMADFSLDEFQHLAPLVLHYGRRSYLLMSIFLNFYMYKNLVLIMPDLIFAHQNGFSGQVAYPAWLSTFFNTVYTGAPIVLCLVLDNRHKVSESLIDLRGYSAGYLRQYFNVKVLALHLSLGVFEGVLCWVIPIFTLTKGTLPSLLGRDGNCGRSVLGSDGTPLDGDELCVFKRYTASFSFTRAALTSFTCVFLLLTYKVGLLSKGLWLIRFLILLTFIFFYGCSLVLMASLWQEDLRGVVIELLTYWPSLLTWLVLPVVLVLNNHYWTRFTSMYRKE